MIQNIKGKPSGADGFCDLGPKTQQACLDPCSTSVTFAVEMLKCFAVTAMLLCSPASETTSSACAALGLPTGSSFLGGSYR